MEKVEYKYPIKSKVYYKKLENNPIYSECENCLGEGKLIRKDNTSITCPYCKGEGLVTTGGSIIEVVEETKVKSIEISIDFDDIDIKYNLKNGYTISEYNLYDSREEVEKSINNNKMVGYTNN